MSRRDLGESLIRRPTTARPAARAADTFQIPAAAQPPAGATHRTTVTYPAPLLLGLKTAALNNRGTLGELVRAAIAAALTTPDRLAAKAAANQRVTGTRTTLDLPAEQHRRLKVLAAENGVTVQALVIAAIAHAHPELI
ncbi:hypothetical protein C0J29_32565 (plasmid) [Mycobacterium paragordonae]|uniref:Antitoxin n=1 Tax=Mycobacterium paragordonae TaxID=1389713 RepID=A0ABQ1CFT3_9MYCO|nr:MULTISPECIES: hypothetical protein [Mycobacterium]AYE99694.1 hypothetical protein C0J29_32565 [Mycobacterium paragordonae]BDE17448.1 hypothetical protein MKCMC460_63080 [Mycobacterium sp. 20KCMC460]GFG83321.1 hypothetical protein MPRG_65970 [Mycobacterium paragordonae]GLC23058.1 hypothetical protein SRL2020472_56290 [Mycobacterium kiyosense]